MKRHLTRWCSALGGCRSMLRGMAVPVLMASAVLFGAFVYLSEVERNDDRATAMEVENLARSMEQTTVRMVEAADQLLRFVQLGHRRDPGGFDLLAWADAYRPADGLSAQLAIIGKDGRLRGSSVDPNARPIDLSDRPHFRVHADSQIDQLFISRPVLGRVSGRWTIQFTRPLQNAAGSFDGVAVLSLDTGYLQRYLDALRVPHVTLAIVGRDGAVRVRAPGELRSGESLDPATMDQLLGSAAGSYVQRDERTGAERLVSFRAVQGYPLLVMASLDLDAATAPRTRTHRQVLAGALLVALFILAFGVLLQFQRRRIADTSHALEVTLARMTQGVVMAAPDGRVVLMNDRARDLLELDARQSRAGISVVDLLARLGVPCRTSGVRAGLCERMTADGRAVETEVLPLPEGGLVLTATDVTVHRAAASAQATARAAAEAANRAKSDFLANMSHEIRTPMNGVMGMLQILRHSGLQPEQLRMAETITRSANALLAVLNDILDYSKLEAGRITLEAVPCDVSELVEDCVSLMRGTAEDKGIALTAEIVSRPPTLLLDPIRVRQILLNLLSNAVKFSDAGEVRVKIASEPDPEWPSQFLLRIAVRDQGIGIAPEALATLFTRFTQADASSTRRFGGTGLGLVISRELARMMRGDIYVQSAPEQGSEFTLCLRATVTDQAPNAGTEDNEDVPSAGPCETLDILVAEDDEVNRTVIAAFLQPHGHRVTFAYNGVDAVLAARRSRFDVILMDVMMPGMDGPTATRNIRELPDAAATTPIIALTANAMAGDRERYLAAGMNAYVSKPINRRELYRSIERLLGVRAFSSAAEPAPARDQAPAPETTPEVASELDQLLGGLDGLPGASPPPA